MKSSILEEQNLYYQTECKGKGYSARGGTPKSAQFVTNYRINLSKEQIRNNKEEIIKSEAAIKKYYNSHKHV